MDRYKASIQSVDTALNRLNQTLASYKLLISESSKATPAPVPGKAPLTSSTEVTSQEQRIVAPNCASPCVTTVTGRDTTARTGPIQQRPPVERLICGLRASKIYPERNVSSVSRFDRIREAHTFLEGDPYCLPVYLLCASEYLGLGYPDVAAGAAYRALLLSDSLDDEADDFHDEASDSLKAVIQMQPLEERIQIIRNAMDAELENNAPSELDPALDVELILWLKTHYRPVMYRLLTRSLMLCGCLRSALTYVRQALAIYKDDRELKAVRERILEAGDRLKLPRPEAQDSLKDWPDSGSVRREKYPWNRHEPDRLNMLEELNMHMGDVSEKLEVRAIDLPALGGDAGGVSTQLGVFAKEDVAPGEEILNETSLLTANNKLQDALCDACSADLPDLKSPEGANVVACQYCEVVFCCQWCHDEAQFAYHPALCGQDVDAIAKDVPPAEAADALYALLLMRALAMAESQDVHPLDLHEVKYIWADFCPTPEPSGSVENPAYTDLDSPDSCTLPRTLPFSFEHNIRLPFHMLEKMDIDPFCTPHIHDVWVFNTLYAKFRGTASARLSGLGGRAARGPEVSAVHPMWCLANHSCDPNVTWEWGGSVKFWARRERVEWKREDGEDAGRKSSPGIKKGEEVLNHYCDVNLPVKDRREWAGGALGGSCRCARCVWEAGEEEDGPGK